MSSQWWQRDRFDLNRPVEESLRPITFCLMGLVDGQLTYERVEIGSNGKFNPEAGGEEIAEASVGESVGVAVGEEVSA